LHGKTWYFDDPSNSDDDKALVRDYSAANGRPPSDRVWFGWYGMRLLLTAISTAKSTESGALVTALENLKVQDGDFPVSFRNWDHQLTRRILVAEARQNAADKWRVLTIKATEPATPAGLEALYGSPAEIGCAMEAL